MSLTDADSIPTKRPLEGITIADLSRVLAGPYCSMLLGDLGANVIKVESPQGDETRNWKPPAKGDLSTYYIAVNRNKRSVALNFKVETELKTARGICDRADVVIENFKPGSLAQYELDYDSVVRSNPDVIYCSISGFGTKGGAHLPGYDLLVQGVSGLMKLTGPTDSEPYRAGMSVFDIVTGLHSCIGILTALYARERGAGGQKVETNLLSSALSALANQTSAYVAGGVVPSRLGNAFLSAFPYEPFPTKDGQLIVVAVNDGQFAKLCRVLGLDRLISDERFSRAVPRNLNREALRPELESALAKKKSDEWFEALTAVGVPCGPIYDVGGGVRLAENLGLEPVVLIRDANGQEVPVVRNPISFSATPATYPYAPPTLGQDGDSVAAWLAEDA